MKFYALIDTYLEDMQSQGRLNSKRSVDSYRSSLETLGQHVEQRDPRTVNRDDVKSWLRRWRPNTQARNRSMAVSFFDWMVEEGLRKDNPARATPRVRQRKPQVYRLTLDEVRRFLLAAQGYREEAVAYLGICAGLRREELRLLQGRHLARDGWVWVSGDIAKGGHERFVPVLPDLVPTIAKIRERCLLDHYVLPAQQFSDPGRNRLPFDQPDKPGDGKTIWRICKRIGIRAGIPASVHPHLMRHAFADHVARHAGLREAQAMLGHADVSTTQGYLGGVTLDDLRLAAEGVTFGVLSPPPENDPESQEWRRWESNPRTEETDQVSGSQDDDPDLDRWLEGVFAFARERGEFYAEALA